MRCEAWRWNAVSSSRTRFTRQRPQVRNLSRPPAKTLLSLTRTGRLPEDLPEGDGLGWLRPRSAWLVPSRRPERSISLRRQLAADRLDHQRSQGNLADAGVAFGTRLEATAEPTGLVASVDHLQHRDRTEAPRWRRATGCQRPRAAPTAVPGGQAGSAGAARSGTRRRPGRHSAARTHPGKTVDVPSDLSGARAGRGQGPAGIRRRCARAEPSSPRRRPQISTMTGSYLAQLSANGPGAGAARRAALRRRWR